MKTPENHIEVLTRRLNYLRMKLASGKYSEGEKSHLLVEEQALVWVLEEANRIVKARGFALFQRNKSWQSEIKKIQQTEELAKAS